jgi:aminopeptidase N
MKYIYGISTFLFCLSIQSCGIFGIHFKVQNPNYPGKLPKFSKETILLGEMTKYRSCFDVNYYDLSIEFIPDDKLLKGTVSIYAIAQNDFDTMQIDLHPNFKINRLTHIDKEIDLAYERNERAVMIVSPQKKGDKFIVEIEYEGKPYQAKKAPWKGGFVWEKDKEKNDWIGVACESDGASIWWPLKDHTADEPDSVKLQYTVPKGLVAVGNGRYLGEETLDTKSIFTWFVSYPINTYNISVYVGNFVKIHDTYKGINGKNLDLDYYVLPINKEKATEHFKQVHNILKTYEEVFGEYPWYNDGFKLIESPYAGMEHQTAIAYGNGYKNDADSTTDYIILHEIAHEWWGNSVTAKDLADVWIQEGFATYAESLFFEKKDGRNAYDNHLSFNALFIKNKYPVVGVKDRRWFHFRKGSDVYVKGAWILHTLREQLDNDSLFFDIIKTFYDTYKYQLVESKDFISLVNQKTEKDYNWFFRQYLNTNLVPELEYSTTPDGTLYYKWTKVHNDFDKLMIKLESQNDTIEIVPTREIQTISLPKDKYGGWNYSFLGQSLCAFTKNKELTKYNTGL